MITYFLFLIKICHNTTIRSIHLTSPLIKSTLTLYYLFFLFSARNCLRDPALVLLKSLSGAGRRSSEVGLGRTEKEESSRRGTFILQSSLVQC